MKIFSGKKILLGITGSIAAYKAAELVRLLRDLGMEVRVVLSESGSVFITPMTLQALSGQKVYQTLLDAENEAAMSHIDLARWADLIVIAPATANFMAKIALGLADDLLSTLCLATSAPIVIAPAMNRLMWENSATQQHINTLHVRNIKIWGPGHGSQACGEIGAGRMLEPEELAAKIQNFFQPEQLFANKKIVITAGPTQEAIDPVRYISNKSSGKMGYAMAEAFAKHGAEVTLISGPTTLPTPPNAKIIAVKTAEQMLKAVMETISDCDIFVGTAAVSDYKIKQPSEQKIKKSKTDLTLELTKNPDILAEISKLKSKSYLIGFAAETENLIPYAQKKLTEKNLDMIIANLVGEGKGFQSDENEVTVITKNATKHFPKTSKKQLAEELVIYVAEFFNKIKHPNKVKNPKNTKNK